MDVDEVLERELRLLFPSLRRARDVVDPLLDPEFREVGASGRLWTRAGTINLLTSEDDGMPIAVIDLRATRVAENLVLVTHVSERAGRRARRCTLWRRAVDGWRALYHQGTTLPEDIAG